MQSPIYQPLKESDEIRIISLLPHGGDPDAPIQCRFEHVELAQRPKYEALSYTWGDQSIQHPIVVDVAGRTVDVGQNCLFALRSLRLADAPRRLWIDALCINQTDIAEKSKQIPIIGHVYQSATQTIIFLQYNGPDRAFHGRGAGPEMQRCWDSGVSGGRGSQPRLDEAAVEEVFNAENYAWFQRAWIVQETLLSFSRTIMCPPFSWSFETFAGLAPNRSNIDIVRISEDYSINKSNSGGWNHVWDGQIGQRMPGDMLPSAALDYLVDTRKFQCKLYHDKVYSILSLFHPPLPVVVGYEYSKDEVHEHLSGALLEVGDSRFLYSTHRESWRANWEEAPNDLTGSEVRYIGMSRAMFQVRAEARWCGLGYLAGSPGESGTIRSLSFKIGEVTKISHTKLGDEASDAKRLKQRWDGIMNELDLPVYEKESGAWPAIHLQKRNRASAPWYHDWIPGKGEDAEVGGPSEKPRGNFYSSSASFFRDRPLFFCESEGVVGIGTHDLEIGDELWYVCGLNVPVCALRQVSKSGKPTGDDSPSNMGGVERKMVGLCFLGVNNDMGTMRPVEGVFPHGSVELVWIV
ncbi:HET-domain-containing protein [Xylariaceae sp. AK1471]|nr:HET-domain-containing protein [Xylariaceae sp. AK1471]